MGGDPLEYINEELEKFTERASDRKILPDWERGRAAGLLELKKYLTFKEDMV